jgi:serine protease Do
MRAIGLWVVVVFAWVGLSLPGLAAAPPGGPQSVASLVARLSPAVVNISSSRRLDNGAGVPFPKAPDGSPLQQYFDDLNPNQGLGGDAMEEAESLGSGFIIRPDGLIVTNNHVIDGADSVLVYLNDGTRLPATIVGADAKTDLAVLKVSVPHPLPSVAFGDSDAAQVGDWVMAIGNPFGLGGTVTLGIVSARNRDIQSGPYDNYIQTDASINQGNSGGPLFDMNGKVVGIATAIIARGGASLGIGFAVPANLARPVVEQLADFGAIRRGWLGVGIQDVTDDIAASLGRPDTHGAMVTDVAKSGPSDGVLRPGDIILDFDGKPIDKMRDLPRLVAETAVGKQVEVEVVREGKPERFTIALGRLADDEPRAPRLSSAESSSPAAAKPPSGPRTLSDSVGFDIAPLDAIKRQAFALPDDAAGLVVTSVRAGSDAYRKGFIAGFLLTAVNQQPVGSVDEVKSLVAEAEKAGRPAVLFTVTDPTGVDHFIAVKFAG